MKIIQDYLKKKNKIQVKILEIIKLKYLKK